MGVGLPILSRSKTTAWERSERYDLCLSGVKRSLALRRVISVTPVFRSAFPNGPVIYHRSTELDFISRSELEYKFTVVTVRVLACR